MKPSLQLFVLIIYLVCAFVLCLFIGLGFGLTILESSIISTITIFLWFFYNLLDNPT